MIDLILESEPEFFRAPPAAESDPAARTATARRRSSDDGLARLFEAVRRLGPSEPNQ